jgi:sugar/nucleoside kinase (ribokinase family)
VPRVITIGEILVEIMAVQPGYGFLEPIELVGPFPSGAPAIFIDQVAKQGIPCAIAGAVGDDDFGRLILARLRGDGVDISAVGVEEGAVTGSAFVRYRPDGDRDFIFNVRHSAAGGLRRTSAADAMINGADHLHVMGSSLSSADAAELLTFAARSIKARGGTVSFDPNVRREMLDSAALSAFREILRVTDLFMPSGREILLFSKEADEVDAARGLLQTGIRSVVLKRGREGSQYFDLFQEIQVPAFQVEEVDPTGAGDSFGATFVAAWLAGREPRDSLVRSNAAGALAVCRRGPMEGTSTPTEIDAFLATRVAVL